MAWSWAQLGPFWALAKLFNGSRVGALHGDAAVTKGLMRATTREKTGQPSAPAIDLCMAEGGVVHVGPFCAPASLEKFGLLEVGAHLFHM